MESVHFAYLFSILIRCYLLVPLCVSVAYLMASLTERHLQGGTQRSTKQWCCFCQNFAVKGRLAVEGGRKNKIRKAMVSSDAASEKVPQFSLRGLVFLPAERSL